MDDTLLSSGPARAAWEEIWGIDGGVGGDRSELYYAKETLGRLLDRHEEEEPDALMKEGTTTTTSWTDSVAAVGYAPSNLPM